MPSPNRAGNYSVDAYEDYRKILDRKDIDVVTDRHARYTGTAKIAIEAMQAGKDIYCEKPLTLTSNEGKQIVKVLDETKRVFQVGTQQRTEMGTPLHSSGCDHSRVRLGTIKKWYADIGGAPVSARFRSPKYQLV